MNTDDLLAACERADKAATPGPWFDNSTIGSLASSVWNTDGDARTLPDEQATMLLTLDHRCKIAFAEMLMKNVTTVTTGDFVGRIIAMSDISQRLCKGEVSESLLAEMQNLTKEMGK